MQIAIVEDTASELDMINGLVRTWLDARNLVVDIACFTAAEGFFAAWSPRMFSLVLLDCILSPDASEPSGMDIAMRIRERDDAVPIVFITTSRDFAIEGYAVQAPTICSSPSHRRRSSSHSTAPRCPRRSCASGVRRLTWRLRMSRGAGPSTMGSSPTSPRVPALSGRR